MDKPEQAGILDVEYKIIHLMLNHRDAVEELIEKRVTSDFFSPDNGILVKYIFEEYVSSNRKRLLTKANYTNILKQLYKVNPNFDISLSLDIYNLCDLGTNANIDDLGLLKNQLIDAHTSVKILHLLEKFSSDKTKSGSVYAAQRLKDSLSTVLNLADTKESELATLEDLKTGYIADLESKRKNPEEIIKCFIPEIDDPINVGFKAGHLTLFAGDVGSHKTNTMLNVALNIYDKQKKSVLFVALEMSAFDLMNRIISNRVGIEFTKMAKPQLLTDDELASITNCNIWCQGSDVKFAILDASDRTTVHQLKSEIEKHAVYVKPRVVVIDYIALMGVDKELRNDLAIGEALKDLRMLGRKHGFHVISAAQIGRSALNKIKQEGFDAAKPDSTALRGSHEYSADSDTIFALIPSAEENKLKIYTIKARHGRSGQSKELVLDASRCRINSVKDSVISGCDNILEDLDIELNKPESEIEKEIHHAKEIKWEVNLDDPLANVG